jgi:hypothetical protein
LTFMPKKQNRKSIILFLLPIVLILGLATGATFIGIHCSSRQFIEQIPVATEKSAPHTSDPQQQHAPQGESTPDAGYWCKVVKPDILPVWFASIVALGVGLIALSTLGDIKKQTRIGLRAARAARDGAKATQRSVESSELQIELAERPWISVKVSVCGPLTVRTEGVYVPVLIELNNSGHTPAIGVGIDPQVHVLNVGKPHPFEALKKQCEGSLAREGTGGEIIFPGATFAQATTMQVPNEQIAEGAIKGNVYVMALTVCVSYRATFKAAARYYTGVNYDLWRNNPMGPGRFAFTVGEGLTQENLRATLSMSIGTIAK